MARLGKEHSADVLAKHLANRVSLSPAHDVNHNDISPFESRMGTPLIVGCQVAAAVLVARFSKFSLEGARTVYGPDELDNCALHDSERIIEVRNIGVRYRECVLGFRSRVAADAPQQRKNSSRRLHGCGENSKSRLKELKRLHNAGRFYISINQAVEATGAPHFVLDSSTLLSHVGASRN